MRRVVLAIAYFEMAASGDIKVSRDRVRPALDIRAASFSPNTKQGKWMKAGSFSLYNYQVS